MQAQRRIEAFQAFPFPKGRPKPFPCHKACPKPLRAGRLNPSA
jgi:hypothetical protein